MGSKFFLLVSFLDSSLRFLIKSFQVITSLANSPQKSRLPLSGMSGNSFLSEVHLASLDVVCGRPV